MLEILGIPVFENWEGKTAPKELSIQIADAELGSPVFVEWKGRKCIVAGGLESLPGEAKRVPKDFKLEEVWVVLVEADKIDLNS